MGARRVVVTGIGVVSAAGLTAKDFWRTLAEGRSAIGAMRLVDTSVLRFTNGAEARDFDPAQHFESKELDLLDRFAQFGVVAAREAVRDAGVDWSAALGERTAIVTGNCNGGQTTEDEGFVDLYRRNRSRVNPMTIPRTMGNAAASRISMEFGITGPSYTISTACASSTHAIGQAFWLVRHGLAELAVTGGSEAPFSMGNLKAWEALRVVSPDTCRPFSKDRRGMILGEGGAMLILEPLEAAAARGAHVYAEIVGLGMSADAHHITQPSVEGPAKAMRAALADAGIQPEQVGYINAHGTGTLANDPTETSAIRAVFGAHTERLPVSSTKSMHGHALGAAGALEAIATALALQQGLLPPTANFTAPDPACDLDVVPNTARAAQVEYALSNSFAFGGLNAVLAFRRWE
jgi:nodulation protein E